MWHKAAGVTGGGERQGGRREGKHQGITHFRDGSIVGCRRKRRLLGEGEHTGKRQGDRERPGGKKGITNDYYELIKRR